MAWNFDELLDGELNQIHTLIHSLAAQQDAHNESSPFSPYLDFVYDLTLQNRFMSYIATLTDGF